MNRELISKAAARRLGEVRQRVLRLDPQVFGEMGFFLSSVKEVVLAQPDRVSTLTAFPVPEHWAKPDTDCLTSLRVLSLHGSRTLPRAPQPPADEFVSRLKAKTAAHESGFDVLAERFAWPLNFSFAAEKVVREYLLMRLMTSDRGRIEKNSVAAVNVDELLLKLNLISVHAAAATDLRFLDALNYYYELLPATVFPESQPAWLLVSWFALYARALNSWV